jgi:glycerol-3-phosphate O-acyltransferase/dihydroxyacetone phosphate acyltransferase
VSYRVLAWFLRLVTRVFFRQVEIAGLENVPTSGPVLFAGNHPNSLIDPILIITTCGRKVHFAAKDSLFKGRIMRAVLRGLGAVPVARKDDHDGTRSSSAPKKERDAGERKNANDAAFDNMFRVLGDGGAIGIFRKAYRTTRVSSRSSRPVPRDSRWEARPRTVSPSRSCRAGSRSFIPSGFAVACSCNTARRS